MLVLTRRRDEAVIIRMSGKEVGRVRVETIGENQTKLSFVGFDGADIVRDELASGWVDRAPPATGESGAGRGGKP